MSGSEASNLGYSNIDPLSNVNGGYVNVDSSNWPGIFGTNQIPGLPGLAGAKSNIDAAAGNVPGICLIKGGSKKIKNKIKNITKHYKKMKAGSRKIKSLKQRIKKSISKSISRSMAGGRKTRRRRHRRKQQSGGYSQYQNNIPITPTYQVAGINLPASQLGLANPPIISVLPNSTNCVDKNI